MRRYSVPYIGWFVYCECGVMLCFGIVYCILQGFVYCVGSVLLCVGMGYCILGGLCTVTVVCCCPCV